MKGASVGSVCDKQTAFITISADFTYNEAEERYFPSVNLNKRDM